MKRQAYHSGSFIGNHCNKYLKTEVYSDIFNGIVSKTREITSQPEILDKANTIATTFHKLFSMFSGIHKLTAHSTFITEDEILLIDRSIRKFCSYFREKFPEVRFTLKLHLLEDHAIDNIKKFRFGMGLLGEQGRLTSHHYCFITFICSLRNWFICQAYNILFILNDNSILSRNTS